MSADRLVGWGRNRDLQERGDGPGGRPGGGHDRQNRTREAVLGGAATASASR
ncbi:hypothetical protein ACWF9X_26445 [Streptomyces globisporus]